MTEQHHQVKRRTQSGEAGELLGVKFLPLVISPFLDSATEDTGPESVRLTSHCSYSQQLCLRSPWPQSLRSRRLGHFNLPPGAAVENFNSNPQEEMQFTSKSYTHIQRLETGFTIDFF